MKLLHLYLFLICTIASSVFADEAKKIGPFAYKVQDGSSCAVELSPVPENAKSFPLDNPNRFVVDIPTTNLSGKNSTEAIKANCLTSLRLGVHKDYARIVIDLENNFELKNFTHSNKTLTLIFENKTQEPNEKLLNLELPQSTLSPTLTSTSSSLPAPSKSPIATPTLIPSSSPTPTAISTATKTSNIQPVVTRTVVETSSPTPTTISSPTAIFAPTKTISSETTSLNSITFDTSNEHIVNFSFSKSPQYSMLKKGANLYWIIISNAQLGNEMVSKPYYASQDFKGIVSVLAKTSDEDLILEIRTDPQVQLFSFREGDSLIVKKE